MLLLALHEGLHLAAVEAHADEGLVVVEEQQAAFGLAVEIDGNLRFIGPVADGAGQRRAVRRRGSARAAMRSPVLADDVAGVDAARDLEVDRVAPRPFDAVGPDRIDGELAAGGNGRDVDEVAAVMLDQVERPDRADVPGKRRADGPPVPIYVCANMTGAQTAVQRTTWPSGRTLPFLPS